MRLKKAYYGNYEDTRKMRKKKALAISIIALVSIFIGCVVFIFHSDKKTQYDNPFINGEFVIPEYEGSLSVEINENKPFFSKDDFSSLPYEYYSPLDKLGRCGIARACLGIETMPDEERGNIGMIKPSGWHTVRYDDLIEDKYLYNRCHLIAYMLSGENDNERNLITGTHYLNISGMLPYENKKADYIKMTGNHVLYRVTPCFKNNNLVASGVLMEACSVEDNGVGLRFNVFIFNVQPGIIIDYSNGDSRTEK